MRLALIPIVALGWGCTQARPATALFGPFAGDYRIIDAGNEATPAQLPEFVPLSRITGRLERVRRFLFTSLGTVQVRPAVGGEYAEWNMVMEDPPHEVRRVVGPRRADGSFPIWRFEQQPAPAVDVEGVVRVERNEVIAHFSSTPSAPRAFVLRERWRLVGDDRLEFALEAGPASGAIVRVGGFTAIRQ